jgi:hypothetical protein
LARDLIAVSVKRPNGRETDPMMGRAAAPLAGFDGFTSGHVGGVCVFERSVSACSDEVVPTSSKRTCAT